MNSSTSRPDAQYPATPYQELGHGSFVIQFPLEVQLAPPALE